MQMKERTALIVTVLVILWLSAALVRTENQRYALTVGMCWDRKLGLPDLACLEKVETRTGWYWHLFYALKG
jgi:hypothetical protein